MDNGGLILIGVYLVQPFLTAASLDLPARIWWIAGVGMLAAGLVAVTVHAAGGTGRETCCCGRPGRQ